MSDLIISGVEAGYGHVRVLHGINLKVCDKPVALMGRNGMGKTTLAQAIMGIIIHYEYFKSDIRSFFINGMNAIGQ